MEKVRLETKDGGYIATGIMPPFKTWPDVVTWGDRVFQLQTQTQYGELTTYREVFAVAIVKTE